MVDVAKIEPCVDLIEKGTSIDEIASLLRLPERLKYHELSEESILKTSQGGHNDKLPQGTLVLGAFSQGIHQHHTSNRGMHPRKWFH